MTDEATDSQYTLGYGQGGSALSERTASYEGGFFLPHIKPGMRVLDCGCGSGSITLGLAETVAPGEVVGIDIGEAAVRHARGLAKEKNISNARFEVASANEIPFDDASFDAVFSHNVLEHLADPAGALKEMYRVLRPSGVIGISDRDQDGVLASIPDDPLHEMTKIALRVWVHNGGDPAIGKLIGGMLHNTGFSRVRIMARIDTYGTKDEIEKRSEQAMIGAYTSSLEIAAKLGWTEPMTRDRIADIWYAFAAKPGAFISIPFVQAVGWKE